MDLAADVVLGQVEGGEGREGGEVVEEGVGDGGLGEIEADDSAAPCVVFAAGNAGPVADRDNAVGGVGRVPFRVSAAVDGVAGFQEVLELDEDLGVGVQRLACHKLTCKYK